MHTKLFYLSLSLSLSLNLFAQGKVGINTTTPAAMLHVKDSSVLFTGVLVNVPPNLGPPPASGPGARMMWYPGKSAFRVGQVDGPEWNRDSIGFYSAAFNYGTKAKGNSSFAIGSGTLAGGIQSFAGGSSTKALGVSSFSMGVSTIASGAQAVALGSGSIASGVNSSAFGSGTLASSSGSSAFGSNTIASGSNATAFGSSTSATGLRSLASGHLTTARGDNSVAFGFGAMARAYASVAVGGFNDTTASSQVGWISTDPIFIIGNGSSSNSRSNAMTVLKIGNVGIGTRSPSRLLHVSKGDVNAFLSSTSVAVFEDDEDVSITLRTPTTSSSSIFFGSNAGNEDGVIAFNSSISHGFEFRSFGEPRFVIGATGSVGIGETTPNAKLHVSGGLGGALYHSQSDLIIEDDNATYLQFSSPTAAESGILSGNEASSIRSGILFRSDSSLQIRSGGNSTRLFISKLGNVGIGTLTPDTKLDVNGSVKIGSNGSSLTEIIKLTVTKDVASIAANSSLNVDFAVANAATTSTVYISPENDLTAGMIIGYARVNAAGTVRIRFTNTTGAAIDLPNMNYYITVIR